MRPYVRAAGRNAVPPGRLDPFIRHSSYIFKASVHHLAPTIRPRLPVRRPGLGARIVGLIGGLILGLVAVRPVVAAAVASSVGRLDLASALGTWTFQPFVVGGTVLSLTLYLAAVIKVDEAHPATPVPMWRVVSWVAGVLVTFVALASFVDVYATELFSIHMVQHLLLMLVGAPLLALGAPGTLLLRVSSAARRRRRILPLLDSRVVRLLTHPLVTWGLFTAALWVSHFSPLYELSLEDPAVHILEHLLYIVSGYLFWLPVVAADPIHHRLSFPVRIGYLFLQMAQGSFLSLAIWQAQDVLYPHYAAVQVPGWLQPIDDQHLAGGIMMMGGDLFFLVVILAVAAAWIAHEEREGLRIDAILERERARSDRTP
ncbi:MAG TPA: cytochrome c oxidase assembly protein [Candidatus Limnocylindrales bacterium]|nr:cytochrome c oxidase assembly protein [Candidatus Limnocylindrales bacterium]